MYDFFTVMFGVLAAFAILRLLDWLFETPARIAEARKKAEFEHHLKHVAASIIADMEAKKAEAEAVAAKKPRRRAPVAKPSTVKKSVAKKALAPRKAAK